MDRAAMSDGFMLWATRPFGEFVGGVVLLVLWMVVALIVGLTIYLHYAADQRWGWSRDARRVEHGLREALVYAGGTLTTTHVYDLQEQVERRAGTSRTEKYFESVLARAQRQGVIHYQQLANGHHRWTLRQ